MKENLKSTGTAALQPPGPSGSSILGNILDMRRQETLEYYRSLYQQYGGIVRMKLGPMNAYLLTQPDHIQHVLVKNIKNYSKGLGYDGLRLLMGQGLVTSEGDLWRQQRRVMQPHFTPRAIEKFTEMMAQITQRLLERWQPLAQQQAAIDMDKEMMRLTMSIIGEAMFSIDLSEDAVEIGQSFQYVFGFIAEYSINPMALPLAIPTPKNRRFKAAMRQIYQFVAEQIEIGRQNPERHNMLSILLNTCDEETGQQMDAVQLRDEVITLFFAGFETTARTLTWSWYLLARHPHAMQKLAAEAEQVLAGRLPTVEDLHRLEYTRAVVDETLRLYPPTGLLARQNIEEDRIDGYVIPAKSMIILSPYITHRLPDVWEKPDDFIPERFLEGGAQYPKHAYLPFGGGPRVCLGNSFALLEMVLALAMAAPRFKLDLLDHDPVGFEFKGTTRPVKDILMKIELRN
jgi:cytochrome P450